MKKEFNIKYALQILSAISTGLAVGATWIGEIDRAIFYLVWAFYLNYLSDKRE
jgi:hypothetical protein